MNVVPRPSSLRAAGDRLCRGTGSSASQLYGDGREEVAEKIAAKAPLAIASAKRAILRGADVPLAIATELEATAFAALFGTRDQRDGMRAFLEKRPAKFEGE